MLQADAIVRQINKTAHRQNLGIVGDGNELNYRYQLSTFSQQRSVANTDYYLQVEPRP